MKKYTDALQKDKLAIFLFHGVIDRHESPVRNFNRKHLDKKYFSSLMKDLKKSGTPVSIEEVIAWNTRGVKLPEYPFVISFDDGFENNLSVAAPILSDLKIPAVFYVTTQFIEKNLMSWVDQIDHAVEVTKVDKVRLPWDSLTVSLNTIEQKISALKTIRSYAKKDKSRSFDDLVSLLNAELKVNPQTQSDHQLDRKMNWTEVKKLASEKLFTLGGHSHTHQILSFLKPDELAYELDTSLNLLKEKAQISSRHYSYPEGLEHCYNDAVIAAMIKRGVVCSPSAIDGINSQDTNLFHLKRINVDGIE